MKFCEYSSPLRIVISVRFRLIPDSHCRLLGILRNVPNESAEKVQWEQRKGTGYFISLLVCSAPYCFHKLIRDPFPNCCRFAGASIS
jgi:hypothetical protein